MIVVFHICINFFFTFLKKHISGKYSTLNNFSITKINDDHPFAEWDAENSLRFDPPAYKQRYERTTEVLMQEKWKNQISKLVDFGCAEFGLFVFLKNTLIVKEIYFVDIDELLLRDSLFRVYPLNADYLVGRETPLTVKVFSGSVSDPDPDLINTDAVTAVEIIEHLYPDILEAFPYNIFSFIKPKVVIVTTPNADFNVLFGKIGKFRHADHKFEWTRQQFESWASNITLRFPNYTVQFDGIGLGPAGYKNLGCCSQLAVFIRKDLICDNYVVNGTSCICKTTNACNCIPKESYGICTYNSCSQRTLPDENSEEEEGSFYNLIANIEYPHELDTRTEEDKILDELKYRIHLFENSEQYYNFEKNRMEIPLKCLVYRTSGPFPAEPELRALLLKFGYQIEECLNRQTNQSETCVIIYEPEMESSGSHSETEASDYGSDPNKYNVDDSEVSDWDEKDSSAWTTPKNKEKPIRESNEGVKTQLHLEVSGSKKQQEALYDSGYQKSPSVPDESPQSFTGLKEEAIALDYKSLSSEKPTRLSNILSVFDNFDKINELDAFRKDKQYFNFSSNLPHREVMKKLCQEIAKQPVAGPSRDPRRGKQPKKSSSSDSDESVEDVRSITTCILENSLNKIQCRDEEKLCGDLIQEIIAEENPALQEVEPPPVVENGDLANNNRDPEGNNYAEEHHNLQDEDIIDNIEPNNVNIDNNNEIVDVAAAEEPQEVEEFIEENIEIRPPTNVEVAWSSREALFDVNSQVDLLEEFDMEASAAAVNGVVVPNNYVIVAVDSNSVASEAVLPEESGFPNWLLQIFEEGEAGVPEDDLHDEPHFYCQGDGLGVHPSTVAINDDDDDEGNESGSDSSSSSSGSIDFANAENQSIQELLSLSTDNLRDENMVVLGQPIAMVDQSSTTDSQDQEDVFENAEGSESNLLSSCTQ